MPRSDDIPEAIRKRSYKKSSNGIPFLLFILTTAVGVAILSFFLKIFMDSSLSPRTAVTSTPNPIPTTTPSEKVENILGHLPYAEAKQEDLEPITAKGHIRLRKSAAAKFLAMQQDARAQGITLEPISGFRSIQEQKYLFFKVKESRVQETTKRAQVSAPPGYSEHHTGYAVDIGDGKNPSSNLNDNFEKTDAFHWLEKNANRYSFEMSFPRNNVQGVSYEPWHWRFIGDQDSLETFYKAKELKKQAKP